MAFWDTLRRLIDAEVSEYYPDWIADNALTTYAVMIRSFTDSKEDELLVVMPYSDHLKALIEGYYKMHYPSSYQKEGHLYFNELRRRDE